MQQQWHPLPAFSIAKGFAWKGLAYLSDMDSYNLRKAYF